MIIGQVLYNGCMTLAELDSSGRWTVTVEGKPDRAAAESLRLYYRGEFGPQDGDPLLCQLRDLGTRTGGSVNILAPPNLPGPHSD
jgi:hypothetical protein